MRRARLRMWGMLSFVVGAAMLISSFTSITAFAILEETGETTVSVLGLVLAIGGLLLVMAGGSPREHEVKLPQ